MLALGIAYGVFSVTVPMGLVSATRQVLHWRLAGRRQLLAVRTVVGLMIATFVWSVLAILLFALNPSTPISTVQVGVAHALVALLPAILGWLPASILLVLALGRRIPGESSLPAWVDRLDAWWA